jgi:hypothetical protein
MKNWLGPAALLALLLGCSLLNGAVTVHRADDWDARLRQSDALAAAGDWDGAARALETSYSGWLSHQTYLHITSRHDAVDDVEFGYRRCVSYARSREGAAFRAELAQLRGSLSVLAEMQRVTIRNVL